MTTIPGLSMWQHGAVYIRDGADGVPVFTCPQFLSPHLTYPTPPPSPEREEKETDRG